MRKYCKAYPLKELRAFEGWSENQLPSDAEALTDTTIVYLWDDWTVVASPVLDQGDIFNTITPAWQQFCQRDLQFSIPEDLRYAYPTK
jgi:hypothetical protein